MNSMEVTTTETKLAAQTYSGPDSKTETTVFTKKKSVEKAQRYQGQKDGKHTAKSSAENSKTNKQLTQPSTGNLLTIGSKRPGFYLNLVTGLLANNVHEVIELQGIGQ